MILYHVWHSLSKPETLRAYFAFLDESPTHEAYECTPRISGPGTGSGNQQAFRCLAMNVRHIAIEGSELAYSTVLHFLGKIDPCHTHLIPKCKSCYPNEYSMLLVHYSIIQVAILNTIIFIYISSYNTGEFPLILSSRLDQAKALVLLWKYPSSKKSTPSLTRGYRERQIKCPSHMSMVALIDSSTED